MKNYDAYAERIISMDRNRRCKLTHPQPKYTSMRSSSLLLLIMDAVPSLANAAPGRKEVAINDDIKKDRRSMLVLITSLSLSFFFACFRHSTPLLRIENMFPISLVVVDADDADDDCCC